jgi:hypothetical protein
VVDRPERKFVNCLSFLSATILAAFGFVPVGNAQAIPSAPNSNLALLKVDGKEAAVGSAAPAPFRKGERPIRAGIAVGRFHKKQFLILSAAVYAAGIADMHQTLHVRHYSWWWETDPFAKPIVKLPAPAYYATGLVLATGLNWLSWRMGHSRRWHRLAPLPQLLAITGNTLGFKSNRFRNY